MTTATIAYAESRRLGGGSANFDVRKAKGWVTGIPSYADSEPHHQRYGEGASAAWVYSEMYDPVQEDARRKLHEGYPVRLREYVTQRQVGDEWIATYDRENNGVIEKIVIPDGASVTMDMDTTSENEDGTTLEGYAVIERDGGCWAADRITP